MTPSTASAQEPAQDDAAPGAQPSRSGSVLEVFLAFLRLGFTCFGGPIAHLGYFRTEFVERRRWLDDRSYSDLVSLCQFLPGPASSQVGMALGLARAGGLGSLAAWAGFTLPSAAALILFAYGVGEYASLADSGAVHGLKVVAVAIVAQAVWGMAKTLCPDPRRAGFAIFAALLTLALPSAFGQIAAMLVCGLLGYCLLRLAPQHVAHHHDYRVSKTVGIGALILFVALLAALPIWASVSGLPLAHLLAGFYRAGALVFGGGHVVLPLLQSTVVPMHVVSNADFVAGYGATQAVPGPLFTFAAYLGTVMTGPLSGWAGGLVFLLVLFLPAYLLLMGALPFWALLRRRTAIQSAVAGVNAGVVGVLLSALYDPVWTSAIHSRADFGLALAAFGLLVYARTSPVMVVGAAALAGWVLSLA
jgi:chromate transporter